MFGLPLFMVTCSPYSLAYRFLYNMEVLESILDLCDLPTIVALSRMSHWFVEIGKWYLHLRLSSLSSRFFNNGDELSFILRACDGVVSGSTALHIMLPKATTMWSPSDLDIYIPLCCEFQITHLLEKKGYHIHNEDSKDHPTYSSSGIFSVVTFTNKHNKIDVVISTLPCGASPIFNFHSTAIMNFISADSIFCAYPSLTFQGLSMINSTQLYNGTLSHVSMTALKKYKARGFNFVSCPTAHKFAFACKSKNHSLTDGGCLWVDVKCVPRAERGPEQIFEKLGVVNINWALGGLLCGVPATFVQPYTRVTGDDSSVRILHTFLVELTII